MRLAALVPTVPLDLVESLEKCGIRTDTELLFSGTAADIFKRLPPETVSLHDLTKYIALVTERAAAPGIRADILLSQESHDYELTSGVAELDRLLGGFGGSRVLEISGDKGSGKSVSAANKVSSIWWTESGVKTLALNIVLRLLVEDNDSGAIWIDTTGDFSVQNAKDMLVLYEGIVRISNFGDNMKLIDMMQGASTALDRLNISLAFDIDAAYDVLETVRSDCSVRCTVTSRSLIQTHLLASRYRLQVRKFVVS
jgi:RAD51-like protein 3